MLSSCRFFPLSIISLEYKRNGLSISTWFLTRIPLQSLDSRMSNYKQIIKSRKESQVTKGDREIRLNQINNAHTNSHPLIFQAFESYKPQNISYEIRIFKQIIRPFLLFSYPTSPDINQ